MKIREILRGHYPEVSYTGQYEMESVYMKCECGWNELGEHGWEDSEEEWLKHIESLGL